MVTLYQMAALAGITFGFLLLEKYRHQRALARCNPRIHVTGTRGKSTVVRYIIAGLEEAGHKPLGKITGTKPVLLWKGSALPWPRAGCPSIIEQKRVVSEAMRKKADSLVVECMALEREYIAASEDHWIKAHLAVITNSWIDHDEVYRAKGLDPLEAYAAVIPRGGRLIIPPACDCKYIRQQSARKKCKIIIADPCVGLSEAGFHEDLRLIFRDNLSLALAALEQAGVARHLALKGILSRTIADDYELAVMPLPDPGPKKGLFVNAFSANDARALNKIIDKLGATVLRGPRCFIYGSRTDRPFRARQFALAMQEIAPDGLVILYKGKSDRIWWDKVSLKQKIYLPVSTPPREILNAAWKLLGKTSGCFTLIGIGNLEGPGKNIVDFVKKEAGPC